MTAKRMKLWAENPSTNVIEYEAAKAARERQHRFELKQAYKKLRKKAYRAKQQKPTSPRKTKQIPNFFSSAEWISVRYQALRRDGGKCLCCGRSAKDGAILNVDHIKSRAAYPKLALTLSNLQVLCSRCNQGKGWRDQTDWR